ncbi:hypothetical protein Cni_G14488 [Canna indica]|uniref:CCHC-type domain-containing protein n=1 Tax=Canna indica TaxID=4628 RepID=A0AAQ3KC94_9LILI|nr:hypothetical protein Cni_G14488 [Canna indica]
MARADKFEVVGHEEQFVVNLETRVCSFNGETLWEQVLDMPKILPPTARIPIGRPKKLRREVDKLVRKNKLKRNGGSMTCSKCGTYGHNKRGCKMTEPTPTHINFTYLGNLHHRMLAIDHPPTASTGGTTTCRWRHSTISNTTC